MSETAEQRMQRQFKNWQWRMGRDYPMTDHTLWGGPYSAHVAMEQALDQRSQHEWFAEAAYLEPEENTTTI
jgi:hypothetical protein